MKKVAKNKIPGRELSPLRQYVRDVVRCAGLDRPGSDYDGMLGRAVIRMVDGFASEGHSGMSARLTREIFNRVLDGFENSTLPSSALR